MNCTWCGATDHLSAEHMGLGRRLDWFDQQYPFREPRDSWAMEHTIPYRLTAHEVKLAEKRARDIVKIDVGRDYGMYFQPGAGETRLDVNIRGFGAELAASRVTGLELHWDYLPKDYRREDKPHDLGKRTEVRNARSVTNGTLWSRKARGKADPIERVFLLVTGLMPEFRVSGWIEGVDIQVPENWVEKGRSPGWAVEQFDLNILPLPEDA